MAGLLIPVSLEFQPRVAIRFVVYLTHGIVHWVALFFLSKVNFWVMYTAPQVRSLRKKVVYLYRSMPSQTLAGAPLGLPPCHAPARDQNISD